ncbi:MAG: CDP-glycerol glycerophosphotransferase family protein [Salinivirgaceae bacterium]|nr:CDP-glycerol glycerophosphotransferase family protein [Salinivirgaceae bacterium]MDD4745943.1 CDP-glycerol glycerophosphotransferase family protein [Salinivirgaceae bacterium]MDY0279751.1 CDP-glycerol glycerophosphotransferase family protein [Salinivirgaceae bacterium]
MKLLILLEYIFQKILPKSLRKALSKLRIVIYRMLSFLGKPYYAYIRKKQRKIETELQGKEIVKVAFFAFQDSIWKYDELFQLMQQHKTFDPIIVVIPYRNYGQDIMYAEMEKTYKSFISRGYKTVKSFNKEHQTWLDVKKEINPDVIYFTTPYRLTTPPYLINNYTDRLTAYVPYGIMTINIEDEQYNQIFHNIAWRCYYETPIHEQLAQKFADNNGKNVLVTGFPGCDLFLDKSYIPKEVWKNKNRAVKRIIWAPHHTIEASNTMYTYSNFIQYAHFFFSLIESNKGSIQIAFKPHPILKLKLYNHPDWGKSKTDDYFEMWNNKPNCQLEEGPYEDLFLTSDALIHDSISFISEYCYTGKPSLFMVRDDTVLSKFNEFGDIALKLSYLARNENDIHHFIDNAIKNNKDSLAVEREEFVKNILMPKNGKKASENILNDLLKIIQTNEN